MVAHSQTFKRKNYVLESIASKNDQKRRFDSYMEVMGDETTEKLSLKQIVD